MKRILSILFFILTCFVSVAYADSTCNSSTSTLPNLDSVYKSGEFRIYYSTNPNHVDYISHKTD